MHDMVMLQLILVAFLGLCTGAIGQWIDADASSRH